MSDPPAAPPQSAPPPPRAFTQGVGLVFQFAGVGLFLAAMLVCCGSSLLYKDWATSGDLANLTWHGYSFQRALTICVFAAVFFGMALAGAGLGMQAQRRLAPAFAVGISALGAIVWCFHLLVAAMGARSIVFSMVTGSLALVFAVLLSLAIAAWREMKRNPLATDMIQPL